MRECAEGERLLIEIGKAFLRREWGINQRVRELNAGMATELENQLKIHRQTCSVCRPGPGDSE